MVVLCSTFTGLPWLTVTKPNGVVSPIIHQKQFQAMVLFLSWTLGVLRDVGTQAIQEDRLS